MINGSLGSVVWEDSGLVICVLPMLDYSGTIKNYFVKQLDDTKAGPPWVLTSEKADFCNFTFENISISIENSYFSVDTFLLYYLWSILKTAVLVLVKDYLGHIVFTFVKFEYFKLSSRASVLLREYSGHYPGCSIIREKDVNAVTTSCTLDLRTQEGGSDEDDT